jgi:PAS domain S-box-containing protein
MIDTATPSQPISCLVGLYGKDRDLNPTWVHGPLRGGLRQGATLPSVAHGRPVAELERKVLASGRTERRRIDVGVPPARQVMDVTVEPTVDAAGEITGISVCIIDVTGMVAAEGAAREARDQAQTFLDIAGTLFLVLDGEGRVRTINRKGCELLGCREADVIGRDWIEHFIPGRDRPALREVFAAVRDGRGSYADYHENPVIAAGGEERLVAWRSTVMRDPEGDLLGVVSTGEDVTELRRTLVALTESETRFRATFDNAAVGIAHVAPDGSWLRVNDCLCAIVGYGREELTGIGFQDITHPEDLEEDLRQASRLLAGEIASYTMEKRYLRRDGGVVWVNLTGSLVRRADGSPDYFIAVVIDISERKAVEQRLAESEERYRLISDYTYDWEYWIGPDGALRWVSPSCQRITGRGAAELIADPSLLVAMVHPDDRPRVEHHFREGLKDEGTHVHQFRILHPNGEVRWVEHICHPVHGRDGAFAGRRASTRDITEHKRTEAGMRRRERQFQALAENSPDIIARFSPSLRHLYVNQAVRGMTGLEPAELLGKTPGEAGMPAELAERWSATLTEVLRTGEPREIQFSYPTPAGQRQYSLRAVPERTADGSIETVLTATRDESARRSAEARVRELAAVVETSGDFIGIAGLDGRGHYLNPAGRALVGLPGEGAVQETRIEDYLLPEDVPFVRETVLPTVLREGRWSGELRFRHFGTGEAIAVHWDLIRIDDAETERPVHLATLTRDIRREKAAEAKLQEADRRKDEFLAVLGHELRNPMAPIRSAVEIIRLLEASEDPRVHWATDVLDRQTNHMSRLLDDLLDVSRIIRGKLRLERAPVSVAEVMQQAVDGVRGLMDDHGHHFEWALPLPDVRVDGDRVRLSQVLLNLLVNAANYTPAGGRIRLSARTASDQVLIEVSDNGPGIPKEQLEELFAPFTQRERRDLPSAGLGLGLTISRRLTELHGGHLTAESPGPGEGAVFRIDLPRLMGALPEAPAPADHPSARGGALRVLLVDDNPDVVQSQALLLKIMGYDVQTATSGPQALELARARAPRIALLDISMPGMDGLELARRLRALYPDRSRLLLAALTGYGHDEARSRSFAAGFDEHLVKPLDRDVLLALLRRVETAPEQD